MSEVMDWINAFVFHSHSDNTDFFFLSKIDIYFIKFHSFIHKCVFAESDY